MENTIINISGYSVIVDREDYEKVMQKGPWRRHGTTGNIYFSHAYGYKPEFIYLHRMLIDAPRGKLVDHVNGDTLDNRKENLRVCTKSENSRNQKGRAVSGLKGAYFHKKNQKWHSSIRVGTKTINLGYFDTAEEAHRAYCKAAKEHYGEFARFA
jgi:hypothetical protein